MVKLLLHLFTLPSMVKLLLHLFTLPSMVKLLLHLHTLHRMVKLLLPFLTLHRMIKQLHLTPPRIDFKMNLPPPINPTPSNNSTTPQQHNHPSTPSNNTTTPPPLQPPSTLSHNTKESPSTRGLQNQGRSCQFNARSMRCSKSNKPQPPPTRGLHK